MRDRDLLENLENCTLPPDQFSHRAHVHAAWICLQEASLLTALPRFSEAIRRYATSLGAAAKYHETITWAFLFLIHERMQRGPQPTFQSFADANPDLFTDILNTLYRPETLASELARGTFVLPDRLDVG